MTYLLLQTFLLLLSAYFLGAFLACLAKRFLAHRGELAAAVPVVSPVRVAKPLQQTLAVKPRTFDPVQPKIDILPRPEPRPTPSQTALDTTRFDRALTGPDPNAGMPRKMIVEIRPSILKSPTGPAQPLKPKETSKPAASAPAPSPTPAAVKPATVQAPVPQPAAVKAAPVQPAPQTKPTPAPAAPVAAPAAAAASAGAAAATAAAAAAVAAAKAAAASVVAAPPKPVTPAPVQAPAQAQAPAQVQSPIRVQVPTPAPAPAPTPAPSPVTPPAQTVKPVEPPRPAPPAAAAPTLVNVPPVKPDAAPQPAAGIDDLQRIRAIDVDTERRLHGIGVRRFDDIARWTPADITRVNQSLGLTGRIDREQWVEQAQILAKGGETYYSRNRAAAARAGTPQVAAPAVAPVPTAIAPAATPVQGTMTKAAAAPPQQTSSPVRPAALQGKSVAEMATAAAAAIAAASASVTRGIRPIEPISSLSRANPNLSMPARLSDAIKDKEKETKAATPAPAEKSGASVAPRRDTGEGDDLKRIRGIGVLIEKRLNALNITTYDQIANWTSGDIDRISQTLDFKGRIERENWVEQARILSSGGHTEFSRRVDRGDVESSKEPSDG